MIKLNRTSIVSTAIAVVAAISYLFWLGKIGEKEVGVALLAFIGTFSGALFAFKLNEAKDNAKETKEQNIALNMALFTLVRQYNAVFVLDKQIQLFKHPLEQAFNCPAYRPPPYADLLFNFDELSFLVASESADVLLRLSVEQEGFHQTMESIRVRNDFYVEKYQPLFAKSGLNGKLISGDQIKVAVGEDVFGACLSGADAMYKNVAESLRKLPLIFGELRAAAKNRFPDSKFVQMEAKPLDGAP
jgi:hypothetical protein